MPSIVPFHFGVKDIRVASCDGEPWFVLRDLLEAMESATTTTAAVDSVNQGLGAGFVSDLPIQDSLGRNQKAIIVSESAATFLLSRSNTEAGRALNRFIHVDVLPSIRKTGRYAPAAYPPPRTIQDAFVCCMRVAKLCGLKGSHAVLSADAGTVNLIGVSPMKLLGLTHLEADPRGQTYTPTELGRMCVPAISARKFNAMLESGGLQARDASKNPVPTEAADGLYEWLDTGKRHSSGAPVKQVRWFVGVLDRLGVTAVDRLVSDA